VIVQGLELPKAARNFTNNGVLYKIDKVLPEGAAVPDEEEAPAAE
jgi:hypothetical protein